MRPLLVPSLVFTVLSAVSGLAAADKTFVGPRAHGMAGANVASVNTSAAQFYNPGALGFFRRSVGYVGDGDDKELSSADNHRLAQRDFDMTVDAAIGYRATGDMGDYLTDLADVDIDALGNLNNGSGITASELTDVLNVLSIFTDIDDEKNTFVINSSVGANVRIKNYAVGVRAFGNFVARVTDVDTANLGIDFTDLTGAGGFNDALETLESILPGGNFAGYTPQNLSGGMQATLNGVGFTADAIDILDYQIGQGISSGNIDPNNLNDITDLLATVGDVIENGGAGALDANTTSVVMTGIGYVEVPVSYGHAFNEKFSVGVSPKLMVGRVYGVNVLVFDDDNDQVLDNINEEYNESEAMSIDIGAMYRMNNLQFGIQGSNLNSPKFEGFVDSNGFTFDDVTVEPQVTVGVAFIPHATMTVEVDLDLLETQTTENSIETQFLSVGAEWKFMQFLALRAGAYQNIASSEVGPVLTGGIGFNLSLVEFDFALSFSPEMIEYDGDEIPEEASVSLGLMIKF